MWKIVEVVTLKLGYCFVYRLKKFNIFDTVISYF